MCATTTHVNFSGRSLSLLLEISNVRMLVNLSQKGNMKNSRAWKLKGYIVRLKITMARE